MSEQMGDLISRKAAINALKNQMSDWNNDYNVPVRKSIENIERLPSAQPEIIRCKDCRHDKNCDIQYHAQAGDIFFCAGAERR